jgi:hypothetical protein
LHDQRRPERGRVEVHRASEALRRDPHDVERQTVEHDRPVQDLGVAREPSLPGVVTDHHDRVRPDPLGFLP